MTLAPPRSKCRRPDRVIDKGKIANLVVTDGDLFAERTKVRYVFVDGNKYRTAAGAGRPRSAVERARNENLAFARSGLCAAGVDLRRRAPMVIQNATVLTVTNGTMSRDRCWFATARSPRSAKNVNAPAGATVIELPAQYVMPGIIDCHSHIMAEAINEGTVSVSSMVAIERRTEPRGHRDLSGAGGRRDLGQHSARQRQPDRRPDSGDEDALGQERRTEMIFEGAMPGIKFALGENPKRRGQTAPGGGARPSPRSFVIRRRAWAWKM